MSSSIREWLNLSLRWFHVFAGIMWVGQTYYFTWLDGQFGKLEKQVDASAAASKVWMVHSGGFYTVEKQKSLGVAPEQLRWFRWEALVTWLAGVVLLVLVYYLGDGLIDPDVADISKQAGIAIGAGSVVAGWIVYDLAVRSPLGKSQAAFVGFGLVMTAVAAWGLTHVFSGRAAFIHVGAMFGTIMTANVWFRILPAQRKMIAAAAAGETFDSALGAQAKLRSKHNTFMAVSVVFLMISNHFPVATYGNRYGWEILTALVLFSEDTGSIRRTFLSPPMRECHREIAGWVAPLGVTSRVDAVGNLRMVYPAAEPDAPRLQRLLIGSHLDTVPNAGAYDGVLGVVLPIALLSALNGRKLPFAIEVVGFSEEEGIRFSAPFIGSRALVGSLDA